MRWLINTLLPAALLSWALGPVQAGERLYDALEAYDAGQVREAEAILERLVTGGNSQAMVMLAGFFETGQAGRVDLRRSAALYHQAALAGERHAQAKWGDYLSAGRGGIERDVPQALCWFSMATEAGHNWAKERLAEETTKAPGVEAAARCE